MILIGTYFGELFAYKLDDSNLVMVKQWKFRSQVNSVAAFAFRNERLQQVSKLFEI